MTDPIVVVGAGVAGLRAAEHLRRQGWHGGLVVIGSEPHLPYNRPPLSKKILSTGVLGPVELAQRPDLDLDWRLGVSATRILDDHLLALDDGSLLTFRGLVIATGVRPRRLNLDTPEDWRRVLRTVEDARRLHDELARSSRVVVLGAGFLGLEVAAAAVGLGCEVHVIEKDEVPLRAAIGDLAGKVVRSRHQEEGVQFEFGRTAVALDRRADGISVVTLSDGSRLVADVVIEAVGSLPNTEWLSSSPFDISNGVLCDVDMHPVSVEDWAQDVVAIGDVARAPLPGFGERPLRIEHWSMPTETAGHAASSLLGALGMSSPPAGPAYAPLPSFWSDQYDLAIRSIGVPTLGLEDVRIIEGSVGEGCVLGYFDVADKLVGVVSLGLPPNRVIVHRQTVLNGSL